MWELRKTVDMIFSFGHVAFTDVWVVWLARYSEDGYEQNYREIWFNAGFEAKGQALAGARSIRPKGQGDCPL